MKITLPSAQTTISDTGPLNSTWFVLFQNIYNRILGFLDARLMGNIHIDTTDVGNVGSGTDDLMSYSLSANSLKTNNDFLEIHAFGTFAANGNNKTISLILGSTTLFTISPTAINSGSWNLRATIVRTSSSAQKCIVSGNGTNAALLKTVYTLGAEDLATALTIKATAVGTADNDIIQKGLTINIIRQ